MQLEDLQAFLNVVRTGSITKAAEQMFITQPTLTYRIQSLEKTLGYQLFERNRGQRQISPTPEGREFYVIAEKSISFGLTAPQYLRRCLHFEWQPHTRSIIMLCHQSVLHSGQEISLFRWRCELCIIMSAMRESKTTH